MPHIGRTVANRSATDEKGVPLHCVLAIDDDPIQVRLIERTLRPFGYAIVSAADLLSARSLLDSLASQRFACILLDYQLPDGNGDELLRWLTDHDSPLAVIIISARDERELVRQTMVDGACDFLSKPLDSGELVRAVAAGIATTARRRQLADLRTQLRTAAEQQERLLSSMLDSSVFVEHKFCPKHDCGGDFLVHHRSPNHDEVFILSDVSGHDLAASVQSSFFHGWMTGVLRHAPNVADALEEYNRVLLEAPSNLGASIAVSAVEINPESGCVTCRNAGGPPPLFVDWWGWIRFLGEPGSSPLGWFPDNHPTVVRTGIPPGPIWVWTDGLESLAASLGAAPPSLAYVLLRSAASNPLWLAQATDDVLVARLWPKTTRDSVPAGYFHPLLAERYGRRDISRIDSIQNYWKNSLRIAIPELSSAALHDILLAAREAALNAMRHGCEAFDTAEFQMLYHPRDRVLRVRVSDPGEGHDFDWRAHAGAEPRGQSCGLLMIDSLSSRVVYERNRAQITLEFALSPEFTILNQGSSIEISNSGGHPCSPTL